MLPILSTNLWNIQTTNLLCSTFVKIVLKMFQRLRSVEHGWADSTTFSQLSFVKIKVYESWPTWRKAPQAFLDFYQQSQLKWFLLPWQKLRWHIMSNFTMGTILEKGFPQGQVHTVHSTSVEVLVTTCEATGNPATDFTAA